MATVIVDSGGADPIESIRANGAGTEKVTITAAGNVGIGTTSPGNKLHVKVGTDLNLRFGYPSDATASIAALNDAGSAYVDARIDALSLQINSQSAGKVGIGTTNPVGQLHIKSAGGTTDQLRLENSGTNGKVWQISDGADAAGVLSIRDQTDSLTIANFNYKLFSSDKGRCVQIGDISGAQNRFDSLVLGQEQTYSGASRDGNYILIRLDNSAPFAQYTAGFPFCQDTVRQNQVLN